MQPSLVKLANDKNITKRVPCPMIQADRGSKKTNNFHMKKRYFLTFPTASVTEPIIYNLVKKYDIPVSILKADINPGKEGNLLVEMSGETTTLEQGIEYLKSQNIRCSSVIKRVKWLKDHCIHCGACTAVCFSEALVMEKKNWKVKFFAENCVACGLCIKACPLQLFEFDFME
jgi:ferredoxin